MENNILGLDVGTNSIGWAVVGCTNEEKSAFTGIKGVGSRIIPMDAGEMSDFDNGNLVSQTAVRTAYRSMRRLRERHLLRRERLHRVLNVMRFLPPHYAAEIDFDVRLGQFFPDKEPKIAYCPDPVTGKPEFYFQSSFKEMLLDFAVCQPELVKDGKKVPYDWTIYYLRKKALSRPVSKEELAWLILHFNQKRGYYEQRGDDEELDKIEEYHELKVVEVIDTQVKNKRGETLYRIVFDNGWVDERGSRFYPDWVGTTKEYIVTFTETKDGETKYSFRIPKEDDWNLVKKKTEKAIESSGKTVGAFIYDTLLASPDRKIRGKLIQTIDRARYKDELRAILTIQSAFHPELKDKEVYETCLAELYRSNEQYRLSIRNKDMIYLLVDNIIFYQRPLKSKKSQIDNCPYEYRPYEKDGERERIYLKCLPKSHPLFEEFRLWQFLQNVRLIRKNDQTDVTSLYLPDGEAYADLFDNLKDKKEINQKTFLASIKTAKLKEDDYNWNYGDRTLPVSSTRAEFLKRMKTLGLDQSLLTGEMEEHLWHILYSVTDKVELQKALKSFALRYELTDEEAFSREFGKIKPFDSDYASYSAKAIKKLLPLMRVGRYWREESIDKWTVARIHKLIDGEYDKRINELTREKVRETLGEELNVRSFSGLPLWLACYVVYGRHSEAVHSDKWESPQDIDKFLEAFRQHSLRNPVVERVVTETLRVVRDIWRKYGKPAEIHIELGREMKSPKEARVRMTRRNLENENTNQRVRAILTELKNEGMDVRPESLAQQEKMKIYEEGVLGAKEIPEDIARIIRQRQPSQAEINRYKCWLEQDYRSPYTGRTIPLSRLFTSQYDIEHIIPQARYYDDSFSNKVICESAVNREKGHMLAGEFIRQKEGSLIELGNGETARVLSYVEYEDLVKRSFRNAPIKKKKLLMEEIPGGFIERQLNDTRYISRYIKGLLSHIVREEGEQEATSKHLIAVNGAITTKLKEDWGLQDVWNQIIAPRFQRLNEITSSADFGYWVDNHTFKIQVPQNRDITRGFSKKRIDHRHHALDALVIACAGRSHVQYLNNLSSNHGSTSREVRKHEQIEWRMALRNKLCYKDKQGHWMLKKPWETFTQDARQAIENTIVSFKQNLRVINKSTNWYQRYEQGEKQFVKQVGEDNWAIRKPLHKETVFGQISLQYKKSLALSAALDTWETIADRRLRQQIRSLVREGYDKKRLVAYFKNLGCHYEGKDVSKVEVYAYTGGKDALVATRKSLDQSFNPKKIEAVTDSGIRQILYRHLEKYKGNTEEAFSPEGIEDMNRNIRELNGGRPHKPVFKVRVSESLGNKFQVGIRGNKTAKYVEAAAGTNLFFAIYISEEGKRSFETIPLNVVVENMKAGLSAAPELNSEGYRLLFVLSPNDLVYIPTEEQKARGNIDMEDVLENKDRIYKMVSATNYQCFFIPCNIASPIVPAIELGVNNKSERMWTGEMIKDSCVKLKISRLGEI